MIFPDRHLIIDFIDTPGLRSQNITKQNEELVKDINLFLKNIPQIAYVILVVDAIHDIISEVNILKYYILLTIYYFSGDSNCCKFVDK